jgi:hypothetical protein
VVHELAVAIPMVAIPAQAISMVAISPIFML